MSQPQFPATQFLLLDDAPVQVEAAADAADDLPVLLRRENAFRIDPPDEPSADTSPDAVDAQVISVPFRLDKTLHWKKQQLTSAYPVLAKGAKLAFHHLDRELGKVLLGVLYATQRLFASLVTAYKDAGEFNASAAASELGHLVSVMTIEMGWNESEDRPISEWATDEDPEECDLLTVLRALVGGMRNEASVQCQNKRIRTAVLNAIMAAEGAHEWGINLHLGNVIKCRNALCHSTVGNRLARETLILCDNLLSSLYDTCYILNFDEMVEMIAQIRVGGRMGDAAAPAYNWSMRRERDEGVERERDAPGPSAPDSDVRAE